MSTDTQSYPRLEDQIDWYDRKSVFHQCWYRRLKVVSIAAAALVPLVSGLTDYPLLAGLLGVVVVVIEGLQHVNQHYDNWVRYRATCENLRHEKYLYAARAAGYEGLDDVEAFRLLAANVEALLSHEGEAWLKMRRDVVKPDQRPPQASAD
jgi:hypothetical protein